MLIFTHTYKRIQMRTNIELDDQLVEKALLISSFKTKKDVIHEALRLYVASLERKRLLMLRGKGVWEGDLDQMRGI